MDEIDKLKTLAGVYTNPASKKSYGYEMSLTATQKSQIQKEKNIKPGTPEWFKLWFALPYMTGEKPIDGDTNGR